MSNTSGMTTASRMVSTSTEPSWLRFIMSVRVFIVLLRESGCWLGNQADGVCAGNNQRRTLLAKSPCGRIIRISTISESVSILAIEPAMKNSEIDWV